VILWIDAQLSSALARWIRETFGAVLAWDSGYSASKTRGLARLDALAGQKGVPLVHVVADTHTVASGLLWYRNPRQVLDAARTGASTLSTSAPLPAELAEVLQRPKFAQHLARANVTPHTFFV
jgi:hypothetical protein